MEMERVTEFPLTHHLDRRPRKRARLGWDVLPDQPKAQLGLFCGQEIGNVTSYAPSRQLTDLTSTPFIKGGSPPWREDDKDGHFVFELGENLTSRCNHLYHHQKVIFIDWCNGHAVHQFFLIHKRFTLKQYLIFSSFLRLFYQFFPDFVSVTMIGWSLLLLVELIIYKTIKTGLPNKRSFCSSRLMVGFPLINLCPPYWSFVIPNVDKIHSKMGEGTFGQVLECWDRERKEMVAVKIVRGMKKYRDAAMIEVEMLQQLGKHDKGGNRCVQIRNWFDYRNHICIVFEKLGPSLYDFLRKNNYRAFPIGLVREIGRQLLECVAFMHDLHLIHTDLKPENILLNSPEYVKVPDYKVSSRSPKDGSYYKRVPKSSAIKVIDFGSTTYDRQNQTYVVSTRHYRAPEVILGLGWSYPCDIWSVGCIIVELCSGEALFQTHENLEHLAMMERVLGPLPQHMLKRVDRQAEKYVRRGRLDWPEGATSRDSIKAVLKLARLQNIIMEHVDHSAGDLINLLQGLLRHDPSERLTAREALRHPFFTRDHFRRSS